jgi:hypothetical protein
LAAAVILSAITFAVTELQIVKIFAEVAIRKHQPLEIVAALPPLSMGSLYDNSSMGSLYDNSSEGPGLGSVAITVPSAVAQRS